MRTSDAAHCRRGLGLIPRWIYAGVAISLGCPRLAWGGMPSVGFSDAASLRLQTISFFVLGLVISAAVIFWIWNSLRRDFPRLPRISFAKSCGIVILWGLLFVVVLTMISGARELMTPGAWEKKGTAYKLRGNEPPAPAAWAEAEWLSRREVKLSQLREQLSKYADAHEGRFPAEGSADEISDAAWQVESPSGTRYVYVPGLARDAVAVPLAYEPQMIDDRPLVLLTNGKIERMAFDEVMRRLPMEKTP